MGNINRQVRLLRNKWKLSAAGCFIGQIKKLNGDASQRALKGNPTGNLEALAHCIGRRLTA